MEGADDRAVEVEDLRLAESLPLRLLELLMVEILLKVGLAIVVGVVRYAPVGGSKGSGASPSSPRTRSSRPCFFEVSSIPLSMTASVCWYYESVCRRGQRTMVKEEKSAGCKDDKNNVRRNVSRKIKAQNCQKGVEHLEKDDQESFDS